MKTAFVLEKINQPESCLWEKSKPFQSLEKKDRSHCASITYSLYNNLERPEKERNRWCTEQQTSNRLTKENNCSWWWDFVRAVKKNPKTSVNSITKPSPLPFGDVLSQSTIWRRQLFDSRNIGSYHTMQTTPKHTSSSVKHGGGSVMAWAYMPVSGVGSLIFILYFLFFNPFPASFSNEFVKKKRILIVRLQEHWMPEPNRSTWRG